MNTFKKFNSKKRYTFLAVSSLRLVDFWIIYPTFLAVVGHNPEWIFHELPPTPESPYARDCLKLRGRLRTMLILSGAFLRLAFDRLCQCYVHRRTVQAQRCGRLSNPEYFTAYFINTNRAWLSRDDHVIWRNTSQASVGHLSLYSIVCRLTMDGCSLRKQMPTPLLSFA